MKRRRPYQRTGLRKGYLNLLTIPGSPLVIPEQIRGQGEYPDIQIQQRRKQKRQVEQMEKKKERKRGFRRPGRYRRPAPEQGLLPGSQALPMDRAGRIILKMASYQKVTIGDIRCILTDLTEEEAGEKASALVHAGLLLKIESPSGSYYRKAG